LSYVNGIKGIGFEFTTKDDKGASFWHLIANSIVNIVLILILQVEVDSSFAAFTGSEQLFRLIASLKLLSREQPL
jgi:hypothetical protein